MIRALVRSMIRTLTGSSLVGDSPAETVPVELTNAAGDVLTNAAAQGLTR